MVEFIYRCGDITSSSNGTLSKEAMNAGSKMHRKLQKMAGSYYDAEVPLKITMKKGIHDLDVTIEGRADGMFSCYLCLMSLRCGQPFFYPHYSYIQ